MAKVALVTGGSRGIGAVTAQLLASRGWDVCLGFHHDVEAAARVVDACEQHGRRVLAVRADVSDEAAVVDMFRQCDERLGTLEILVNNVGIVAPRSRVDELDWQRLQRMMAVNVIGSFLCAREAIRRMSNRYDGHGGSIVNVSSVAARLGSAGEYVDYAASKGAIDTMTLGLAREVAEEGIRVNAVRAGVIDTEIHASSGQPDRAQQQGALTPMKRAGEPAEVAGAIAWLCSDEASYVTGALLDVAGGR
jgi:NAD(P)-dependent dehydrogenase (short-subunit alcohol dehydrogenase family)